MLTDEEETKLSDLLNDISDLYDDMQHLQRKINRLVERARDINQGKPVEKNSTMQCIETYYADYNREPEQY